MNIPWRKILIGKLTWKRLIRSVLFMYLSLLAIGLFFSNNLIFPYRSTSYSESLAGLEFLETPDDIRIATRYWRAEEETHLILFFHGNAEDLGHIDPIVDELFKKGYSILALDYRGYGLSEGKPTEDACYKDATLLYENAIVRGYKPEQVIAWGRSVGSGIAVELARTHDLKLLVLESPFTTAFRTATHIPLLPFDRFNNLAKINEVDEGLLILHGDEDTVIPAWHSEKLYHKHNGPKERLIISGAGHNDLWLFPNEKSFEALSQLLDRR